MIHAIHSNLASPIKYLLMVEWKHEKPLINQWRRTERTSCFSVHQSNPTELSWLNNKSNAITYNNHYCVSANDNRWNFSNLLLLMHLGACGSFDLSSIAVPATATAAQHAWWEHGIIQSGLEGIVDHLLETEKKCQPVICQHCALLALDGFGIMKMSAA